MNKLLILSIAVFTLFSCSSDDENLKKDPIIGEWSLFSKKDIEVNECGKKSSLIFNENGVFTIITYDDFVSKCEKTEEVTATWRLIKNQTYALKFPGSNEELEIKINFSDDKNTIFKIVEFEDQSYKRK